MHANTAKTATDHAAHWRIPGIGGCDDSRILPLIGWTFRAKMIA